MQRELLTQQEKRRKRRRRGRILLGFLLLAMGEISLPSSSFTAGGKWEGGSSLGIATQKRREEEGIECTLLFEKRQTMNFLWIDEFG